MNIKTIAWKELWERPTAMITSLLAIALGVTALVAIRHITVFSERAVKHQLAELGANILILPPTASLQDYYSADINGGTLLEEHVSTVLLANLAGVEKLSPKLCTSVKVGGEDVILTGVLPQSEMNTQAAWQSVGMFTKKNKHEGCTKASTGVVDTSPEALASLRTIEELDRFALVVGSDVATATKLRAGASLVLFGTQFTVRAVLPPTGTVDDGRIFAHLHTVQDLTKAGEVVSAIEVMGCCEDAAGGLVPQLKSLLPDAKVVTVSQVVETQVGVNRLLAKSSILVLGVLILVGGATVASATSANVRERRREIGTLMALGATPNLILRLFLLKATWLGLAGGIGGCLTGIVLAVLLGPHWAGVTVSPLPSLAAIAVTAALGVTLVAAFWPARSAAQLDPCTCFREI
jgi:putative ABC transport system permease protein